MKPSSRSAYLYLLPVLIGFVVFTLLPVISTLYLSFTRYEVGAPPEFVGLGNYQEIFRSPLFWQVVLNTFYYTLLYVPASIVVSLGLALLIERKVRGVTFFRTVYFLPVVTSTVAGAIMWTWLYNGDIGLLNFLLSRIGVNGPKWLQDPHWALPAISLMSVWKNAGYNMMIFLAGLANIPQDYYEAAVLDGARSQTRFFRITLPLLSPILFFVTIVTTISAFQVFEQTYVLTMGGPANATLTLSFYIWQTAFQFLNLGNASALSYLFFLLLLALTFLQFQVRKRWVVA